MDTRYAVGNWYWKQYAAADFFDNDQPLKELTTAQWNQLIYGHPDQEPTPVNPKLEGICRNYERIILKRDLSGHSKMYEDKMKELLLKHLVLTVKGND